MNMCWQLFCKD